MFTKRNKTLFIIVIFQAIFFIAWSCLEASKLSNPKAKTILVKVLPIDPRDYISGNYLTLRYEFSNSWGFKKDSKKNQRKIGDQVYAVLKKQDKWFVPDYISNVKPAVREDQVVIKGNVSGQYSAMEYGIEKYFINENLKEPSRTDKIEVLLVVGDDLEAKIKAVMVNDKEFK
jgi:uncharacterized membrane-anchored protein